MCGSSGVCGAGRLGGSAVDPAQETGGGIGTSISPYERRAAVAAQGDPGGDGEHELAHRTCAGWGRACGGPAACGGCTGRHRAPGP